MTVGPGAKETGLARCESHSVRIVAHGRGTEQQIDFARQVSATGSTIRTDGLRIY